MGRDRQPRGPRVQPPAIGVAFLLRTLVLAIAGVAASVWALARYYTHPREPMYVPAPASLDAGAARGTSGGAVDWGDAAVIPAPEIEIEPR